MNKVEFLTTLDFEKDFKRLKKKYHSLPDDLKEFKTEFLSNPNLGIELGNNIRKIRISIKSKGKGKSGGGRIIVYELIINVLNKHFVLVAIYDKSELDTLSLNQIKVILSKNGF